MKWFLTLVVVMIVSSGCECGLFEYDCDRSGSVVVQGKITLRGEPFSGVFVLLQGIVPENSPPPKLSDVTTATGNYRVSATFRSCDHDFFLSIAPSGRERVTKDLGKGCKTRTVNHDFK